MFSIVSGKTTWRLFWSLDATIGSVGRRARSRLAPAFVEGTDVWGTFSIDTNNMTYASKDSNGMVSVDWC